MDRGCLPYIVGVILVFVAYYLIIDGDKGEGGFDSIGRFFVFALVLVGIWALFKFGGKNKE